MPVPKLPALTELHAPKLGKLEVRGITISTVLVHSWFLTTRSSQTVTQVHSLLLLSVLQTAGLASASCGSLVL